MTRSAILYNLNMIDLKLGQLIHDNEELPDCELTEKFLMRYHTYIFEISDKCRQLLKKYEVDNK